MKEDRFEVDKDLLQSELLYKRINKKNEKISQITVLDWKIKKPGGYEVFLC